MDGVAGGGNLTARECGCGMHIANSIGYSGGFGEFDSVYVCDEWTEVRVSSSKRRCSVAASGDGELCPFSSFWRPLSCDLGMIHSYFLLQSKIIFFYCHSGIGSCNNYLFQYDLLSNE